MSIIIPSLDEIAKRALAIIESSTADAIQTDTGIIKSLTIPANTLFLDGQILKLMMRGTKTGTVETKTIQTKFAGNLLDNLSLVSADIGWLVEVIIIRSSASTARGTIINYTNGISSSSLNTAAGFSLAGLDFSASQTFELSVSASSGTSNVTHSLSFAEAVR